MATDSFFNVSAFRKALQSGAKPNLFKMGLTIPAGKDIDTGGFLKTNFNALCKSGAIPGFTVGVIEVPFRGRRIKVPGDRTYAEWTATIVNDQNQEMRKAFDRWLKAINNPDGTVDPRTSADDDYRTTILIQHLKTNGNISRQYTLEDAFPTDVSAIDLSYDTTDAIQEFTVTFQYHYVTVGNTVDAAGNAALATEATSASVKA